MTRKREKKDSDPSELARRMEKAHAEGKPLELDYDECTGVLDVALGKMRSTTDASIRQAREAIAQLAPPPPKVPA